ncbi:MAG: hypothetical protein ACI89X_001670 [Planctomycetota bacterium]|jgi:hypothetical protein
MLMAMRTAFAVLLCFAIVAGSELPAQKKRGNSKTSAELKPWYPEIRSRFGSESYADRLNAG